MSRLVVTSVFLACLLALGIPGTTFAGIGDSKVLDRIQKNGVINIGYPENAAPFSYIGPNGKPIGYTINICMRIVDAIRHRLNNQAIKVRFIPVTDQTRFSYMANGQIDLECGATTNNLTRQTMVSFLPTTFITGTRILARKDSGAKGIEDLVGKTLAVAVGTTNQKALQAYIQENKLDIELVTVENSVEGLQALENKRIDAYGADAVLLYDVKSKAEHPNEYAVIGNYLSFDSYGILVPRNDSTFEQLGTSVLAKLMRSEQLHDLYAKWFEPGPTNINIPLSKTLSLIFQVQGLPD